MLYFVTGNKDKIRTAEAYLLPHNIQFTAQSLQITEIQSESIEEIAKDKAEQAYIALKKPLIVNDHGWSIPGLLGFPGAFMKYMNEWFTPQDFLNLTRELKDRRIILIDVLCFTDGNQTKIFKSELTGTLITEIKGSNPPAMTITTFDHQKTVAEYFDDDMNPFAHNKTWEEFSIWYSQLL